MWFESELCPIILSGTAVLILLVHFFSNGIIKSPGYYFSEFHCVELIAHFLLLQIWWCSVGIVLISWYFLVSGLPESVQGLNIDMQRSWYQTLNMVKLQVAATFWAILYMMNDVLQLVVCGCLAHYFALQ